MKLFVGAKGIVHYKGKVLLLRESSAYVDGSEEGKWDMVGGRIESNEDVRDGLVREVREESGLEVDVGALIDVFDGYPNIRGEVCHVVRLYFLCTTTTDRVSLGADHDAYEWVDPDATQEKVLVNDIKEMLVAFKEKNI